MSHAGVQAAGGGRTEGKGRAGREPQPGDPGPAPPPPPAHPDPSRVPGASPRPSHAGPPASFRSPAVCRAGGPRAALAQPAARRGPRPDPSGRAPPPRVTHLRPRPRPNAEAAAGWRGQAARPRRHSHLPFPRHSAHPPRSAREQPPRSSAAPKSKGVRLRHHNQMAEPPRPAAQPAHWALPPPAAAAIGCCSETLGGDWPRPLPLVRGAADPASTAIRLVCAAGAGGSRTERSWLSLQSPKTRGRGSGVY